MTVVGAASNELRDEVCVTRMNLHAIKTALTRPIDCLAELLNEVLDLRHLEATVNGRRVEVEPGIGTDRHTMTGVEVRHVSAVSELNRRFGSFGMDCIGHAFHVRNDIILDIQLSVKRHTAQIDRAVRN